MIETTTAPLSLDSARERVERGCLRPAPPGLVGLELEAHLVDRQQPERRVPHERLRRVLETLPELPGGSALTVEPGGQLELSGPPAAGVEAAVTALSRDRELVRRALAEAGLGLAGLGCDPARRPDRVNPGDRYCAMEEHFCVTGQAEAGLAMMCSTASLQVNLEAGEEAGWAERVRQVHRIGPVLVAVSACSPLLAGRRTGWRSTRQAIWSRLDPRRCGPLVSGADPAGDWAEFALGAPVMLVRPEAGGAPQPVRHTVPFRDWVTGVAALDRRRPTAEDLDLHLTTLFPPVRLRGFLELRYLDAVPDRWWPALAAITATLVDHPRAAAVAAEACEPVAGHWLRAARIGLGDAGLRRAAERCLRAAAEAAPPALATAVAEYADLVTAGRSPGDAVADLAARRGPLAALTEDADA